MTPHFLKWSFGPKRESVDGICQQTDSRNRFYLDVKTGPNPFSFANLLLTEVGKIEGDKEMHAAAACARKYVQQQ